MSLSRVETKVGYSHMQPTEEAKKGYLFGNETHEMGPRNVLTQLNVLAFT